MYKLNRVRVDVWKIRYTSPSICFDAYFRCNYEMEIIFQMAKNHAMLRALCAIAILQGEKHLIDEDSFIYIMDFLKE